MKFGGKQAAMLAVVAVLGCNPGSVDVGEGESSTGEATSTDGTTSSGAAVDTTTTQDGASGEGSTTEAAGDSTGVAPEGSRCEIQPSTLVCTHQTKTLFTGVTGVAPREVHWQTPLGEPPANGWPAVFLFQGSLFTAELFWTVLDAEAFGFWNQGLLTKALLDAGFVVITPEASLDGNTAWQTNIPPASLAWEESGDHQFMLDLFEELEAGTFGAVDVSAVYAAGISSGGYMTSRMDEAYRARFRALAIHSASYATCGGPACVVPGDLDAAHRPTLFLHGGTDVVVPQWTMELYRDALDAIGVETGTVLDPGQGHGWIDEAPTAIVSWFQTH
ncbi:MAG: plasmid partitioning protein [Myxococcota bacterium]